MLSPLVLFRLLLSVALVLNGIGGAMAATRMHVEQASTAEQVRMPASAGMPCHDEQGAAEGDAGAPHEESPAPDCCKSRLCACARSEEHTSALQSLMRLSYAVFCLK